MWPVDSEANAWAANLWHFPQRVTHNDTTCPSSATLPPARPVDLVFTGGGLGAAAGGLGTAAGGASAECGSTAAGAPEFCADGPRASCAAARERTPPSFVFPEPACRGVCGCWGAVLATPPPPLPVQEQRPRQRNGRCCLFQPHSHCASRTPGSLRMTRFQTQLIPTTHHIRYHSHCGIIAALDSSET